MPRTIHRAARLGALSVRLLAACDRDLGTVGAGLPDLTSVPDRCVPPVTNPSNLYGQVWLMSSGGPLDDGGSTRSEAVIVFDPPLDAPEPVRFYAPEALGATGCGCWEVHFADGQIAPDQGRVSASAGTVRVSAEVKRAFAFADYQPDRFAYMRVGQLDEARWYQPGQAVRVSADGADVPAFSTTLTAPTEATLVAAGPPADSVVFPANPRTIPLSWSGADQMVFVELQGHGFEWNGATRCLFNGPSGFAQVPLPDRADVPTLLTVRSVAMVNVAAGAWTVPVLVGAPVRDAKGAPVEEVAITLP